MQTRMSLSKSLSDAASSSGAQGACSPAFTCYNPTGPGLWPPDEREPADELPPLRRAGTYLERAIITRSGALPRIARSAPGSPVCGVPWRYFVGLLALGCVMACGAASTDYPASPGATFNSKSVEVANAPSLDGAKHSGSVNANSGRFPGQFDASIESNRAVARQQLLQVACVAWPANHKSDPATRGRPLEACL
jgi:hypothetical protein